jgi:hypothetical protein
MARQQLDERQSPHDGRHHVQPSRHESVHHLSDVLVGNDTEPRIDGHNVEPGSCTITQSVVFHPITPTASKLARDLGSPPQYRDIAVAGGEGEVVFLPKTRLFVLPSVQVN